MTNGAKNKTNKKNQQQKKPSKPGFPIFGEIGPHGHNVIGHLSVLLGPAADVVRLVEVRRAEHVGQLSAVWNPYGDVVQQSKI